MSNSVFVLAVLLRVFDFQNKKAELPQRWPRDVLYVEILGFIVSCNLTVIRLIDFVSIAIVFKCIANS